MDKKWTNDFDPLFPLVRKFWHLHMTQHRIVHIPSGLPWWHKPSLWQQWRHVLSKNHGQAILTPYSPSCHRFNTATWLSIELSTYPVGCHGGTSRRYGNNDVMFCPKTMAKRFWPPIPHRATVSTLSHDSASNSPHTQWVAMVAQAVAMATMTSCFVQKPWPSDFDFLLLFRLLFQDCHIIGHANCDYWADMCRETISDLRGTM